MQKKKCVHLVGSYYIRTVIPELTSDPTNEDFFRCFSDSANEYGFG
jgi:hypothetical protein